ncbi:MAG: NAD-dependent epimerase/dehydratase family protein [Myxococcota bacterium]
MKHCLIVGASGDTGVRLAACLRKRGHRVSTTSREAPLDAPDSYRVDPIGEPNALREVFVSQEQPFDVVVNLVGTWLRDPERANLGSARALLPWIEEFEIPHYMQCSATTVYGDRPGVRLDESVEPQPDTRIGQILVQLEGELEGWCTKTGGSATVLRLPHVYGPERERSLDLMREGRMPVAGTGENIMAHLRVEDLVELIAAYIELGPANFRLRNASDGSQATYGAYCDFVRAWDTRTPLPRVSLEDAQASRVYSQALGPHFDAEPVLTEFFRYMTASQWIDSSLAWRETGLTPRYPSFQVGLPEALGDAARQSA